MFKRYMRWIVPLVVLTLLIALMLVTNGMGAFAAGSHVNGGHYTVDATATPVSDDTMLPSIFWHP